MSISMNSRLILGAALTVSSAFAAHTYDYSQSPVIADTTRWQTNGTAAFNSVNTSSRITSIEDTRAVSVTYTPYSYSSTTVTGRFSYTFTYNNDSPVHHLVSVANWIGTGEFFTFTYSTGSLGPPFGSDPTYAGLTTTRLASVSVATTGNYAFTYDTSGASELLQATLPAGGHFRWNYVSFQYTFSAVCERSARAT